MNPYVLLAVSAKLLKFCSIVLIVPTLVSFGYKEDIWLAWLAPSFASFLLGIVIAQTPKVKSLQTLAINRKESFLCVVFAWMLLVCFTSIAFFATNHFGSYAHAFFESMSGFTTTGATIFSEIESLPHSILFMRSWSHWIGGMGIIVLSVAILPDLGIGGTHLFSTEATGLDTDKLAPKIANTARRLWGLYFLITFLLTLALIFLDMSIFDAINHSMATIATGGFSTKNQSIYSFNSSSIEWCIGLFMWVSGLSFTLQYRLLFRRQIKSFWKNPEVKLYLLITVLAIGLISLNLLFNNTYERFSEAFRYSAFQVVSVITTTGFGTADFNGWPDFSRLLLVLLMLVGACAGSTAGGSKMIRLLVVIKHTSASIQKTIRPRLIKPVLIAGKKIPPESTNATTGYYLLFFGIIVLLAVSLTWLGMDLVSGTTASISVLNSIGPGLGTVGASENYGHIHSLGLYLLSFGMLLGRLEIYPILVLCSTHFWKNR